MSNVTDTPLVNTTESVGPSAQEIHLRWRAAFAAAIARMETPPLATTIISVTFMILIILGNLWVIMAVIRQPKLRNSATNVFIVSMSISDLIIGVAFVPIHITDFAYGRYTSSPVLCFITGFLHSCAMCGTTFSLIAIGFDRYRAIVHPLKPKMTVQQGLVCSGVIWLVCVVYSIQVYANFGIKTFTQQSGNETIIVAQVCTVIRPDIDKWMRVEYFCVLYAIPLVILGLLYGIMIKTLWFGKSPSNSSNRSKKKAVKMLSFVVLQFALTWGPLYSLQIYYSHETNPPYNALLFSTTPANISILLSLCNSCINPVLYAYYNENFQKEFVKLFPCFYKKTKVAPEPAAAAPSNTNTGTLIRSQRTQTTSANPTTTT
ncbi:G-protein coupled receptor 83-like [Ptychodera flava]|uniref:G-protein coupled receptor 83-like n=1 Tax=Ptychodera flava TaxID=63121 RepID=UPI003969C5A2